MSSNAIPSAGGLLPVFIQEHRVYHRLTSFILGFSAEETFNHGRRAPDFFHGGSLFFSTERGGGWGCTYHPSMRIHLMPLHGSTVNILAQLISCSPSDPVTARGPFHAAPQRRCTSYSSTKSLLDPFYKPTVNLCMVNRSLAFPIPIKKKIYMDPVPPNNRLC